MKSYRTLAVLSSFVLGLTYIGPANGEEVQSNFQITPPPLGYPVFEAGKKSGKVGLSYLTITGQGIDIGGYGVNFIGRNAYSDKVAADGMAGLFLMNGSIKADGMNADLSMLSIPLSVNVEYQPLKTPTSSIILFAGPLFSLGFGSFDMDYTVFGRKYSTTSSMTTYTYGLQGGAQYSAELNKFRISPFVLIQYQEGTASSDTNGASSSIDIPGFTTITYGFDIMYVPWGVTLSALLQNVGESGKSQGFETTMLILGWNF
jgi:hypothetical protein